MSTVYLGLGSNLGNRQKNIKEALSLLSKNKVVVEKVSTIIETEPVGGPPQGKFLNAVARVSTHLSPHALLKILQAIECQLGRRRTIPLAPRTIDIDILTYDHLDIQTKELTVPHPRMKSRDFVLRPLKEIDPSLAERILQ